MDPGVRRTALAVAAVFTSLYGALDAWLWFLAPRDYHRVTGRMAAVAAASLVATLLFGYMSLPGSQHAVGLFPVRGRWVAEIAMLLLVTFLMASPVLMALSFAPW